MKNTKLFILMSVLITVAGCANVGGNSALGKAGDVNDRITDHTILTLCDPLREPALLRRYGDQPDKLAAIKELCK